jgi:hypothetical protein
VKSFGGTGLCIPGYERIAQVACVARVTVERAIFRLEAWGLITWDHRIKRVFEAVTDLAGEARRFLRPSAAATPTGSRVWPKSLKLIMSLELNKQVYSPNLPRPKTSPKNACDRSPRARLASVPNRGGHERKTVIAKLHDGSGDPDVKRTLDTHGTVEIAQVHGPMPMSKRRLRGYWRWMASDVHESDSSTRLNRLT